MLKPNQKLKYMTFSELNLHAGILKTLENEGLTTPTPIQLKAIPKVLAGYDLRASAQTGTGKTAAFLLPALNRLTTPSALAGQGPRILILVPTRELAMQVAEEARRFSANLSRVKTVCIYGGAPYPLQNRELSRPYEILVATPGRLIDHMSRGRINFNRIEMLVLDEADRMLDMGFIEPVEKIAAAIPKQRQTLLFSATLKGNVLNLSNRLMNNPIEISVISENSRHENIEQRLHFVDDMHHKSRLLDHLLNDPSVNQAIIFTATKRFADQLVDILYENGHPAAALHGDMNQRQRSKTIMRLRDGEIRVLVATDVAARGIDVQTISHVINFDLPTNAEDYVHRIGRTGRAGAKGIALSFAASKDMRLVRQIEQFTGYTITPSVIAGMEPKSKPSKPSSSFKQKRPFKPHFKRAQRY
ncbi:ATP-dependent RNA helicase RhlE|nr:ATP-dependent RNA helicase RhlE [Neochlamydia sp. AcF95]NGY95012.1 ATP-dependent RNA helicase RhlE [Neochlamydia sp. AcF84]